MLKKDKRGFWLRFGGIFCFTLNSKYCITCSTFSITLRGVRVYTPIKKVLIGVSPCKAKVTDFEYTVGIDQEISRLDISVNDFCWMKVFDSAKKLVQEDLDMIGREVLRWDDDLVQVRLHQLRDHVDLREEVQMRWLETKRMVNYWSFNAANDIYSVLKLRKTLLFFNIIFGLSFEDTNDSFKAQK